MFERWQDGTNPGVAALLLVDCLALDTAQSVSRLLYGRQLSI